MRPVRHHGHSRLNYLISNLVHRFFHPPQPSRVPVLRLEGTEAHHALHVLRVRRGERVLVLDGAGVEYSCEVVECQRRHVDLKVLENTSVPPLPWRITLVQAVPKGKLIESIIQKATELGVNRVVPLLAERVVTHLAEDEAPEKKEKWRAVAIEAIKQCGSAWLPEIETPLTPHEFLARHEAFDLALVGSLQPDSRHPREFFRQFAQQHGRKPASVCIWIGPEGDFTPDELQRIQAAGARPISLGRLVLRTETAAIYCLAISNYELSQNG